MSENVILVLDSYFNVVEWHGETIRAWIDAKYHQMKEYAHVTELVESPRQDIEYLMSSRFPTPVYYLTHRNHSK